MVYHASNGRGNIAVEVLDCASRLDAGTMVKIKERMNRLLRKNQKRLLLDLAKTEHVDLAGLGMLVERLRLLRTLDGDIKLCNLRRHVSETLRMVGLGNVIEAYDSREEALRSFCFPQ